MKKKAMVCVWVWTLLGVGCGMVQPQPVQEVTSTPVEISDERITIELSQAREEMSPGWNLGNALDAYSSQLVTFNNSETLYGNPETTKEMIHQVKEKGFRCVRIPVTYRNHMDQEGNIEESWLDRVQEVTDYVLGEEMFCIINIHHDVGEEGWLTADRASIEENKGKFSAMWTQIGERFAQYDEHLVFEGYNEILNSKNQWSNPGEESFQAANEWNQIFVDTIRSLKGKNQQRILLVNTYGAGTEPEILENFQMPTDTLSGRILVGVHGYQGLDKIEEIYQELDRYMLQRKIPVILSETAIGRKNSLSDRVAYAKKVRELSQIYEIPFLWWDDGCYGPREDELCEFALLNRNTLSWTEPEVVQELVKQE